MTNCMLYAKSAANTQLVCHFARLDYNRKTTHR